MTQMIKKRAENALKTQQMAEKPKKTPEKAHFGYLKKQIKKAELSHPWDVMVLAEGVNTSISTDNLCPPTIDDGLTPLLWFYRMTSPM